MKEIVVAKFTYEGKTYVGKREVNFYDGSDDKTRHANVGLKLEAQRQIREAVKAKHGLKTTTTGGEVLDYSSIETV